jgi:hypothetical protein
MIHTAHDEGASLAVQCIYLATNGGGMTTECQDDFLIINIQYPFTSTYLKNLRYLQDFAV